MSSVILVELKRDAVPEIVLNQLYKLTPMQDSLGISGPTRSPRTWWIPPSGWR